VQWVRLRALARLGQMADQGDFDEKAWSDHIAAGVIAMRPIDH
jgi:hypothetical protein